jgi:putative glycosyltransferase (TIGR04372 family)
MEARVLNLDDRDVLVARPRDHALGLLLGDLLVATHVARATHRRLLLLDRSGTAMSSLLRLQHEGVELVPVTSATARVAERLLGHRSLSKRWRAATRRLRFVNAICLTRIVAWTSDFHRSDRLLSVSSLHRRWVLGMRALNDRVRLLAEYLPQYCDPVAQGIARVLGRDARTARKWEKSWRYRLQGYRRLNKQKGRSVKDEIGRWSDDIRKRLKQVRMERSTEGSVYDGHDLRRYAALHPLRGRFSPEDDAEARLAAERVGIPLDRPLVTLHVREGKSLALAGVEERGKDYIRNAEIAMYGAAIDTLCRRGYCVVRIGDPSMPPVPRQGLIDLATHPEHNALLDFWCVARSRFFVASDSGPYLLSWLFNVPCLAVNIVNLLGVYPLRACDRYLVKRVRLTGSEDSLSLQEMLTEDFLYGFRRRLLKKRDIELIDNTDEDIRVAVEEMDDALEYPVRATPLQQQFRELVATAHAGVLSRAKLRGKVGRETTYLGDGLVSDSFVRRYFAS